MCKTIDTLPQKRGWYTITLENGTFSDVWFNPRTAHWLDKDDMQVGCDGFAFNQKITSFEFIGE